MLPTLSIRPLLLTGLALALAGCGTTNSCHVDNPEYLQAQERARLQLPDGVSGSERLAGSALVIPAVAPNPDKLDPAPRCLDEPPGYFKRAAGPGAGPTAGSPEEAVNVWAMAWASRKPDQVAAFYSPAFETTAAGGAAAYIEDRRQQVTSGPSPEPRLDDVKVTGQGSDRSVVTFVQLFGTTAVRKELTLAREAQGWRIVAERTLETP
jgi:hypothetical protein